MLPSLSSCATLPSPARCPSPVLPSGPGHGWVRVIAAVSPQIQHLAIRCIQKNLVVFQAVRHWPWWQLLSHVRPLLSVNLAEEQLRAKEVSAKGWDEMGETGQARPGCFRGSAWGIGQIGSHFCTGKDVFATIQRLPSVLSAAVFALCHTFCRALEGEVTSSFSLEGQ